MRIIRRYIGNLVLGNILLVLAALLMLFGFFDLIYELKDVGAGGYKLSYALTFIVLSLPGHLYELLPVAALIGSLLAIAQLVTHSEYAVMRTAGVSILGVSRSLAGVGIVLALTTLIVGEYLAPISEEAAQRLRLKQTSSVVAQSFRSGLWVKDNLSFVNVGRVMHDSSLQEIKIYEFDEDYRLHTIRQAKVAVYTGGNQWNLQEVVQTKFGGNRSSVEREGHLKWTSVLTPDILSVLLVPPQRMSLWTLFSYIQHLRKNGQDSARYEIALWTKVVYPIAVLVMMVLALPFAYMNARAGGIGGRIFAGIMLGLGFHLLNRLFGHVGFLAAWPPFLTAMLPTLLFLVVGIGTIRRFERR
ncbi:MAG: LPS export ABC transporter permease LptG [Burkholderiales bacterium]